jgi:hypothetical protein
MIESNIITVAFIVGVCVWLLPAVEGRLFGPWPATNLFRQVIDVIGRIACVLFLCLLGWGMYKVAINAFHAIVGSAT